MARHLHKFLAVFGVLLLFLLSGGLWVSVVSLVPAGLARDVATVAFGLLFVCVFIVLLLSRVKRVLQRETRTWLEVLLALSNLAVLLLGFALIYMTYGVIDNTATGRPVVYRFWACVYLSIVTFTTVGYGDYYPVGIGRAMAGIQGLTGYVVLGMLASVSASILQRRGSQDTPGGHP